MATSRKSAVKPAAPEPAAKGSPATKAASKATPRATPKAASKAPSKAKAAPPPKAAPQAPLQATPKAAAKVEAASRPAPAKPEKPRKPKLVRDSFTIPKAEYAVLDELKQRAARLGAPAKKSEVLRAGIKALAQMSDVAFMSAMGAVPAIKTGRPGKAG